jgi:sugar-specific transcriptional regulator TrmB
MKKILDYLERLGFSQVETKLYLTLLKHGPMTVSDMAKVVKINRTAAYTPINSLLEKGIFKIHARSSHKKLVALQPDRLHYLIDNQL